MARLTWLVVTARHAATWDPSAHLGIDVDKRVGLAYWIGMRTTLILAMLVFPLSGFAQTETEKVLLARISQLEQEVAGLRAQLAGQKAEPYWSGLGGNEQAIRLREKRMGIPAEESVAPHRVTIRHEFPQKSDPRVKVYGRLDGK